MIVKYGEVMRNLNIVEFQTEIGNKYIYDPCCNRVFCAPDPISAIIKDFYTLTKEEIVSKHKSEFSEKKVSDDYERVKKIIDKENAFYLNDNHNYIHRDLSTNEYWSEFSESSSYVLILGITEACNMRCSYCVYGGTYKNERIHGTKNLDYEIAKKSIDYYLDITSDKKRKIPIETGHRVIGFYGGEPLLAIDLIKKCVDYVRKDKRISKDVLRFQMTTNGTLLSKENLEFLEKNDFTIVISLDGPEEEHDRKRKDINGNGTHRKIIENVKTLKDNYPILAKNVMFKPTFDYNTDLVSVDRYFVSKEGPGNIFFPALVSSKENNYLELFSDDEIKAYYDGFSKLEKEFYQIQPQQYEQDVYFQKNRIKRLLFGNVLSDLTDRKNISHDKMLACCLPGIKLFVDVDGNYHICERCNNTLSIGNYQTGLELDKINNLRNKFFNQIFMKNECWKCENRNMCKVCFATEMGTGEFINETLCDDERRKLVNLFIKMYSFLEKHPYFNKMIKTYENGTLSFLEQNIC